MNRFEIPIEPRKHNLFFVDDYLRSIRTPEARKQLIASVGYSSDSREAYELEKGLPRGAVEFAIMCEDRRIREMSQSMVKRFAETDGADVSANPEVIQELFAEIQSVTQGLRALYPEAIYFIMQYNALAQRNKASFRGDYQFGNEYNIIRAQCAPGSPLLWGNTRVATDTNVLLMSNVALAFDVVMGLEFVIALWVGLAVAAGVALVAYFAVAVWTLACLVVAICPVVT